MSESGIPASLQATQAQTAPGLLARALLRRAGELGVDIPELLREANAPPALMEDAAIRLTGDQMDRLWLGAMEASGDPSLGFLVGQTVDPTELGPGTVLIASADTLEQGLELAVKYSALFGRQTYRLERQPGGAVCLLRQS